MSDSTVATDDGGIKRLIVGVGSRVLMVLSISVWVAWVVGGFGILVIDPPLPAGISISLKIDDQGLMLQKGPAWRRAKYVHFEKRNNSTDWRSNLSDLESTWITPWIVVSVWTAGGFPHAILGVKYGLLLFASLITMGLCVRHTLGRKRQDLTLESPNSD